MKAKFLLLLCVAMLSLVGCTDSGADNIDPPGSNDDSKGIDELEVNESYGEPPALTIRIDGETIRPVLGSYNWMTEYDDDTAREIYATSLPPPELVKKSKPLRVKPGAQVEFDFDV